MLAAGQEAWLAFSLDPSNNEHAEAYVRYHSGPMLDKAREVVDEYRANNYFAELSGREAFNIDPTSIDFNDDYTEAVALACEIDGAHFFQRQPDGTTTLLSDSLVYKHWSYELIKQADQWKIRIHTRAREDDGTPCP